jgi:hypothetical protein
VASPGDGRGSVLDYSTLGLGSARRTRALFVIGIEVFTIAARGISATALGNYAANPGLSIDKRNAPSMFRMSST